MQIEVNICFDFIARGLPHTALFDVDGTFVNSEGWWYQTETEIIANLGTTWSRKYVTQIVGSSLECTASKAMAGFRLPINPQEPDRRFVSRVCEVGKTSKVSWRPGAYRLLSLTIDLGVPTTLVTPSCGRPARIVMKDTPLGSLTTIIMGDHGLLGKSDPASYLYVAGLVGTNPSSSLVIEGSMFGVRSGMTTWVCMVHVPYIVDVLPAPGLVEIDSLESIDRAALQRFIGGERPQGGPYADGAPNLRAT